LELEKKMRVLNFTCWCMSVLAFPAGPAFAADPQPNPTASPVVRFDAISVTATRTETRVFDYPGSAVVVGEQEIEGIQPKSLGDILEDVPGVTMNAGPRTQGETPLIRGLGDDRILIKVDGARRNFTAGHDGRVFIDPDLLKQVEIVRGPASSIYGSGAIGGVIELTTKDAADFLEPGQNLGAQTKLGFQSVDNDRSGRLTVFGRSGAFDAVFSGAYGENDNIDLGTGGTLPNSSGDEASGFGKFSWRPTPDQTIKISLQRFIDDAQVPINPQSAASSTNPIANRELTQDEVNLEYRYHDIANKAVDFKVNAYSNALDIEEDRVGSTVNEFVEFDTTGLDVQNTSIVSLGGGVINRLTYGGEVYQDTQRSTNQSGVALGSRPGADALTYGVFLQDEVNLTERLTVIPGIRYDRYERESGRLSDTSESAASPKVALGYKALDWLSFHGAYSHSFRAPSFIELYVSGQHFFGNNFVSNPNLQPEKARTWEGGFGLQFKNALAANDRLRFKATYFQEEIEDFIELVVTSTTSTNQNRAEVNRRGGEAELTYDVNNLGLALGYAAVRAEDASNSDSIDSTPADKLVLGIAYRVPEYNLGFRLRNRYAFEQNAAATQTDAYFVQDVGVNWEPDSIDGARFDFGIDNIFDAGYRRHNASLYEAGRNFKLTYTQQF
jgi:hemoglobin/transferrin/lactoferrin receptor protein